MVVGEPQTLKSQSPVIEDPGTSPAPRQTTVRQIEANRKNALRSTGPKTVSGKQASRLNALTHGLRAKDVIIPGQEDPAEFEAILRELNEEWEPEGHTQIHVVEEIGLAVWRLRRAHLAELGEIRTQMPGSSARDVEDVEDEIRQAVQLFPEHLPRILRRSIAGINYQRNAIEDALSELENKGTVSESSIKNIEFHFGKKPDSPSTMLRIWFLGEAPEGSEQVLNNDGDSTQGGPDKKAAAREELEMTLGELNRQERKLLKQERTDFDIARQRLRIPESPELERIQRYETSIKRGMYRDIDLLERLQRRQRGEPPLPTVKVDISHDH
jgi:hypothetical protein